MGLKKVFKKKEPVEEEIKRPKHREEKFGAFKEYAQEKLSRKPGFQPVNPYANIGAQNGGSNPYANNDNGNIYNNNENTTNPYGAASQGGASNPYGASNSANGNGNRSNMYGGSSQRLNIGPAASSADTSNPYANSRPYQPTSSRSGAAGSSAYSRSSQRGSSMNDAESTLDLNDIPSNPMHSLSRPVNRKPKYDPNDLNFNQLDLNQEDPEDDLNLDVDDLPPEQEQVNSEDEEVDRIKQDIRFVKQESLQLTYNTLRMAQEADAGATNTLGMLGSQSERLYNVEQNLLLADTQTKLADTKVDELRRLNRSIFVPTYTPFTKKKRYEAAEQKLKAQLANEKYTRDKNRSGMYESELRVKQGLTSSSTSSDTYKSYRDQQHLDAAKRYKFDSDSEDDEMEKQIGNNLDQIGNYAKKLNSTAKLIGLELNSQNERLKLIEENADKLDIDVHMNTSRLKNIR